MGTREIWTYSGRGTVYFRNGKVERVRGSFSSPDNPSASETAPEKRETVHPIPASKTFRVPKPLVVSEPGYRVKGPWGGESDGKTIGIAGKPLSDHKIYANDSYHFAMRMNRGLKELESGEVISRVSELRGILRARDESSRDRSRERFAAVHGYPPQRDKYYNYAKSEVALERARYLYDAAEGNINYKEQIRVKDRFDLDNAPSEEGRTHREEMKKAIRDMEKARAAWLAPYRGIYEAGRNAQRKEFREEAAKEIFAVVKVPDTQLFAYGTFARTPMAEGLAEASRGRVLMRAKPIFLPNGARVQVLESRTIDAPVQGGESATTLRVSRIRLKTAGMRQHDGAALPELTVTGWVLESGLKR